MPPSGRKTAVAAPSDPSSFLPLPHLPFHVLLALAEEDLHGWAIIKKIQEITEGRTKPSSGSLYLAMVRLRERGLIEELAERPPAREDDERRRYYRLTSLGRRVLEAESSRLAGLVDLARQWDVLGRGGAGRGGGQE